MGNQLATTTKDELNLGETAEAFARSGMFKDVAGDAVGQSKALVKILAGRELGIPPFAAMSGIHIIEGKAVISAGLMAALVKKSGKYNYRVLENSPTCARIAFYEGGELVGESVFTIEDAKAARLTGKQVWQSYARNMLYARAMSNGARWFCADVFSGLVVYTPEEMGATVDGDGTVIDATPARQDAPQRPTATPSGAQTAQVGESTASAQATPMVAPSGPPPPAASQAETDAEFLERRLALGATMAAEGHSGKAVRILQSAQPAWGAFVNAAPAHYHGTDGAVNAFHVKAALAKLGFDAIDGATVESAVRALRLYAVWCEAQEAADRHAAGE